jgi:hypothetical protein
LLVALVALAAGSCVYASMRDLRDLGIGETKVTCASRDGKVHCSCRQKCYSEEHDCRCADER